MSWLRSWPPMVPARASRATPRLAHAPGPEPPPRRHQQRCTTDRPPAALLPNRVAHAHACHAAHAHALCHAALCPLPCSLPLLIPLPSAPSAPAPAQRPGCPSPPPPGTGPLPHALGRGVLSATAQEPGSGVGLRIAPYLYARAGHHINKFVYIAFIVRGPPT